MISSIGGTLRLTERDDNARIATITYSEPLSRRQVVPEGWAIVAEDGRDIKEGAVIAKNGAEGDEIRAEMSGPRPY